MVSTNPPEQTKARLLFVSTKCQKLWHFHRTAETVPQAATLFTKAPFQQA